MDLLTVGQIVNIFGIQGELKIVTLSHFADKRYQIGAKLLIRNETKNLEKWVTVTGYRRHRGLDLVKFEGIDANNAAKYFSWYVLAEKDAIALPDGSYYYDDLVGCRVVDEDGHFLGTVVSLTDFGAHATLIVQTEEDRKMQIPFVPFFIKQVAIKDKTITVHVIEGL